jgi:hypothetical protein
MNTNRKTATIVGILYIIGTVAGVLSVLTTQPVLNRPDYLMNIVADENRLVTGTLLVLTMGLALAMVPVMLFPILREYNEVLALGYVVFRGALETLVCIMVAVSRLLLIVTSHEYVAAGAPDVSYFQSLGAVLLKGQDAINPVLIIVFSLDALMLYYMFYQSKLIPRWISVWGFIAILMHFSTAFLILFRIVPPNDMATLGMINFPILVQEMVMAAWLILKGFHPSAIAESAQPSQLRLAKQI